MLHEDDLGEPFARGGTAALHRMPDGRVIKVFADWVPSTLVQHEAAHAQLAHALGVPTPRAWPVERVGPRLGIPMEDVGGVMLAEHVFAHPDDADADAIRLAEIHARIATSSHLDLRPGKSFHRGLLESVDVGDGVRTALLDRFDALATGTALCHGDLHAGNVLRTADGRLVVIDWGGAHAGNPAADATQTVVAMTEWLSMDVDPAWKVVTERFIAAYRAARTDVGSAFDDWLPVTAAIRLATPHPPTSEAPLRALIDLA